jgi:low temperature requirement protein LtrA
VLPVINPVHFAERHTLFVIICLGEALVAIGATASDIGLTLRILIGLVAAASVACVVWCVYFAFIPSVSEHKLQRAGTAVRGRAARDLFTFGHFPIATGIIAYAVVKAMVADPTESLPAADRWMLIAALVMLIGGCLHIHWHLVHRLTLERFVAVGVAMLWLLIDRSVPDSAAVGGIAVILAVMQSITWRQYRAGATVYG